MTESSLVAGVDEAGRGPLAGSVFAACVILDQKNTIAGLDDSKKLSEKRRNELEVSIKQSAVCWNVAQASALEIDDLNILQATMLAMSRAVKGMSTAPQFVRVDGNRLPPLDCAAEAIVSGDALHEEISAASILAKQARDRDMVSLALQFPEYGFEKHKGYPTRAHILALQQFGVTPCHRRSFGPVKKCIQGISER